MFKTDATVRFGQILSAIEFLGMGNFNEYIIIIIIIHQLISEGDVSANTTLLDLPPKPSKLGPESR